MRAPAAWLPVEHGPVDVTQGTEKPGTPPPSSGPTPPCPSPHRTLPTPSLDAPADAALAASASAGDVAAFEALVRRHETAIYNLVVRLVDDPHFASDLVQESFLRAYRAIREFRGDSTFATWIHRIAVNVCHTARARRRRAQAVEGASLDRFGSGEHDGDRKPNDPPDLSLEPTRRILREEREQAVRAAIDSLDPEQRTVVVMRDLNGLSYEEIAGALGWPIGTVRSRLHRARLVLQRRLRRFGGDR